MSQDRTKTSFRALAALDPMVPYRVMYRAKVISQDGDSDLVGVRPDDPDLPDMAQIPLRHGIPGARVAVPMGSYLLVGWDDGRPDRPFAALWTTGILPSKVSIQGEDIRLGSSGASHRVMKGDVYQKALNEFLAKFQSYISAIKSIADPSGLATATMTAGTATLAASAYLSEVVKTI